MYSIRDMRGIKQDMLASPGYKKKKKKYLQGLPHGPMVKTPPCQAGGVGSIPDGGTKVPHATWCSQ